MACSQLVPISGVAVAPHLSFLRMVVELCYWEESPNKKNMLISLCANCLALFGATLPINIPMATALPRELAASSALRWRNLFEQASYHTSFLQGARPACDDHPNFLIRGVVRAAHSFHRCSPRGGWILESCSRLCLAGALGKLLALHTPFTDAPLRGGGS